MNESEEEKNIFKIFWLHRLPPALLHILVYIKQNQNEVHQKFASYLPKKLTAFFKSSDTKQDINIIILWKIVTINMSSSVNAYTTNTKYIKNCATLSHS